MGVRETGELSVPRGEALQGTKHGDEPSEQKAEPVAHHDEIGIVGDEGAGCPEVQKGACRRGLIAEGVNVGHDIVPEATLVPCGNLEVGIVQVGAHLRDGLLRYVESELTLGFRQRQPESSPQAYSMALTPQYLHGRGRVA
jgi:hypothetical protein